MELVADLPTDYKTSLYDVPEVARFDCLRLISQPKHGRDIEQTANQHQKGSY